MQSNHIRNGSLSASIATSPKNPLGSIMGSLRRNRSKSDIQGLAQIWREAGGPPVPTLAQQATLDEPVVEDYIKPENSDLEAEAEEDDDDDREDDGERLDFSPSDIPIIPNFVGFQEHVQRLNQRMEPGYLVDRIAHQQVVRYKALLGWAVKHQIAIQNGTCNSGAQCMALHVGSETLFDSSGAPRDSSLLNSGLGLDLSDGNDSNPEGALTAESFPSGVPMPPASTLPAEFECRLCFRVKKFNKPSDWTKHVHEDVQPFTCTYQNCREPKSFKRKADWVRHENERHRHLEWWTCLIDDCTHKCYRKDNFLQHLVREHKLPEPKAKTKAAVKLARGTPDEQVWQMVRECHHETPNKPQDELCKFCGKSLGSWKKLTVHLAKHMEQISLPVLDLVKQRTVDANTIISPVEPLPAPRHTPLPVTPVDSRRLSNPSMPPYGNLNASVSPGGHSNGHYSSPFEQQTSPNDQGMHQFGNSGYRNDMTYNQVNTAQGLPFTATSQPMMFDNSLGYDPFNQMVPNPNLSTQSRGGYSSIDHSPHVDQSQGFNPINQQYNMTPIHQGYHSHPSSNHTQSPDPSFVPHQNQQHISGFQGQQALRPDMAYTSGPQQMSGFPSQQNPIMDMDDGQYDQYSVVNDQGYGQPQMNMAHGNQGMAAQQGHIGRGQSGQQYPPSTQPGYGGYGR
jgi:hypothetical protein